MHHCTVLHAQDIEQLASVTHVLLSTNHSSSPIQIQAFLNTHLVLTIQPHPTKTLQPNHSKFQIQIFRSKLHSVLSIDEH